MSTPLSVPVIDISEARTGAPEARRDAAAALDAACRASGFFAITGHGVDAGLIDDMRRVGRTFFGQDPSIKAAVAPDDGMSHRGYLGMATTALSSTLGDVSPPDLSESFNIGLHDEPVTTADDSIDQQIMCWPNRWPDEPASLRPTFERYFAAVREVASEVLQLLATAVGAPERSFVPSFGRENTSMLLMNYYPALVDPPRAGQLRRGAHTDYGIVTVLYAEGEPGLQVSIDGAWHDVPSAEGAFIVNLGDLMARWVNDRWRSTLHRVVVPSTASSIDRISIPLFVHPDFHTIVETVPTTITDEHPMRYEPVLAGPWIAQKSQSMMETSDSE